MAPGDLIRYLVLTVLGLAVLVAGMKFWGRHKVEKRIVHELRILANPTSSFEQIYAADAEVALMKSMAELHRAEEKLKKEPSETLDEVFHGKGKGALFPDDDPNQDRSSDPRVRLIKEGLLRNFQHCRTLGLFEESESLKLLEGGERPEIAHGPAKGSKVHIRYIIDPKVVPGVEKLVPNMVLGPPPDKNAAHLPNDFEIKQAKALTTQLYRAEILERNAQDRIVAHYDLVAAAMKQNAPKQIAQPEEEPEEEPEKEQEEAESEPEDRPETESDPGKKTETDEDPFPC